MTSSPERLLGVILDATPVATVLVDEQGNIVFTNAAARLLFFGGQEVAGQNLLPMLATAPEPLRRPLLSDTDQIFTVEENGENGEPETYHLAKRHLDLDGAEHTLITVRHMTREIARQEVTVLKKTLRIIGHELANSMAPAASLLRSAQRMLARPEQHARLGSTLQTIEERLVHLQAFLSGLATLGQLPRPQHRNIEWTAFLDGLRALWPQARIARATAAAGWFDPAQIQQVLINLVKNAHEAGSPHDTVEIDVEETEGGIRFTVADRGHGMTDDILAKALVPSFTTKERGSGMGLALCREIVDGHDGRLRIGRREGGGTAVSFWLPGRTAEPSTPRARLTLTGSR